MGNKRKISLEEPIADVRWLDGVTVTPSGVHDTTRQEWREANAREKEQDEINRFTNNIRNSMNTAGERIFDVISSIPLPTSIGATGYLLKTGKRAFNIGKQIFDPYERVGHVMNVLAPVGYDMDNFKNVIPEIKRILEGKSSNFTKSDWYNYFIKSGSPVFRNRIEAYKLWGRRSPSSNVYIKNADGTYSYNLKQLKNNKNLLDEEIAKTDVLEQGFGRDRITGNGGDIGITLKNPNTIHIEDKWDLQPFQEIPLFTNIARNIAYKLPEKLGDKLGYKMIDYATKLDNKIRNIEVSPLLGGKPFTLSQDIPVIKNSFGNYSIDWSKVKRCGGRKSLKNI